jgi:hypothetical protein
MSILAIGPPSLGGLLGAFLAAGAVDTGMSAHGLLFVAFCVLGIVWVVRRRGNTGGPADPKSAIPYNDTIVRAGVIASVFWGWSGSWSAL